MLVLVLLAALGMMLVPNRLGASIALGAVGFVLGTMTGLVDEVPVRPPTEGADRVVGRHCRW